MANYKWVKGDNFGNVVSLDQSNPTTIEGDITYVNFVGGSRINQAIFDEYLMEVGDNTMLQNNQPKSQDTQPIKQSGTFTKLIKDIQTHSEVPLSIALSVDLPDVDIVKLLLKTYGDEFKDELRDYIIEDALSDKLRDDVTSVIDGWLNNIN